MEIPRPWGVRLRPEVRVNRRVADGAFAFGAVSDRSWRIYAHSDWLDLVIDRCTVATALSEIFKISRPVDADTVYSALTALVEDHIFMWVEEEPPTAFDEVDLALADIYASQAESMSAANAAVATLRNARVDIVGVGGLGTWVAWQVAANGIGRIVLHDADRVEARNAAYQPLCAAGDAGRPKVAVVAEKLGRLFPKTTIEPRQAHVEAGSDPLTLAGSDCVLGCGDEPSSEAFSLMLTEKCVAARVPVILGGGYAGHDGRIGVSFVDEHDPCFHCWTLFARKGHTGAYTDLMPDRHPPNAIGGVTSVVSTHHVHEALKIITGIGSRELRGVVGDISVDSLSPRWTAFEVDPACPHH